MSDIDSLNNEYSIYTSRIKKYQGDSTTAHGQVDTLDGQINALTVRIKKLQDFEKGNLAQIDGLCTDLTTDFTTIGTTAQQGLDDGGVGANTANAVSSNPGKAGDARSQVDGLIARLQAQQNDLTAQRNTAQGEADSADQSAQQYTNLANQVTDKLNSMHMQ